MVVLRVGLLQHASKLALSHPLIEVENAKKKDTCHTNKAYGNIPRFQLAME